MVKEYFLAKKPKSKPSMSLFKQILLHIEASQLTSLGLHIIHLAQLVIKCAFLLPLEIDLPNASTLVRSAVIIIWFSRIFLVFYFFVRGGGDKSKWFLKAYL